MSDLWKCIEVSDKPGQPFGICGFASFRQKDFEAHLMEEHNYGRDMVVMKSNACLINRNSHIRFWCGFCGKLEKTDESGGLDFNDRFTHISDHFIKENMQIGDWIDVEKHTKKSDIKKLAKNSKLSSRFQTADLTDDSIKLTPSLSKQKTSPSLQSSSFLSSKKRKSNHLDDFDQHHSKKQRAAAPKIWGCVSAS
jgi:hypothetical protein